MTEMYMHTFDTHKYIKELQGTGFNEAQAEVIVKSLLESREYDFSKLATRDQIKALEEKVDAKIDALRGELKSEIANTQSYIIRWMVPFMVTIIAMIAGLFVKLL